MAYDLFVLYFTTYAFFGWLWEFCFVYVTARRFHWHGFLRLPILPIYGFAAVGMILFVRPYIDSPALVFVGSMILVTLLELGTGIVLDHVLHMRLWDYRGWPLNLHGYVSLFSSLGFGLMGLLLLYGVQPWVGERIGSIPDDTVVVVGTIITIAVGIDFANSLGTVIRVRVERARDEGTFEALQERLDEASREFTQTRRRVNSMITRWYKNNVGALRHAFPRAELTGPARRNRRLGLSRHVSERHEETTQDH